MHSGNPVTHIQTVLADIHCIVQGCFMLWNDDIDFIFTFDIFLFVFLLIWYCNGK